MEDSELINDFYEKTMMYIRETNNTYNWIINPREKIIFSMKHPFLKYKYKYPKFDEVLNRYKVYTEEQQNILKSYYIKKIVGIFKHAKSGKTEICNNIIMNNILNGVNSICLAKNTLEANAQWNERLVEDLKKRVKHKIKAYVYVISSKKTSNHANDDSPTHCKSINEFIQKITTNNLPWILFVCSNNVRVCQDLPKLLASYEGFVNKYLIDIIPDEAHNSKEGITNRKNLFEWLIINPYIRRLMPCTATRKPLFDEKSTLWIQHNLENNAYGFTENLYTSDSPEYSSLHDATPITLEHIRSLPNYKQYGITEFDKKIFKKHFKRSIIYKSITKQKITEIEKKREIDFQIHKRMQLEFCHFFDGEINAFNDGLNIIDNITGTFDKGISLITSPCRNVFTESLMLHAVKQPYNPLIIGLYNSEIHIMYDKESYIYENEDNLNVLNEKINDIIQNVKRKRIVESVIITGNPQPTGESITFVHTGYGTLKNMVKLSIGNDCQSYQSYCRCNYLITKFLQNNPTFISPPKYIIGEKKSIEESLGIEKSNDALILHVMKNKEELIINKDIKKEDIRETNISVPVRFETVAYSHRIEEIKNLWKKSKRDTADKHKIMMLLKECVENEEIEMNDKTGKFNFEYTLKDIRSYKKHNQEEIQNRKDLKQENYKPFESDYRFESYKANYSQGTPYINNKTIINQNECEMLCCLNKYSYGDCNNGINEFWISYKFDN
jgi:hypothetical protein